MFKYIFFFSKSRACGIISFFILSCFYFDVVRHWSDANLIREKFITEKEKWTTKIPVGNYVENDVETTEISRKNYQKKLPKVFTVQKRCRKNAEQGKKRNKTCVEGGWKKKGKKDDNGDTAAREEKNKTTKTQTKRKKIGDQNERDNQQEERGGKQKERVRNGKKRHCRAFHRRHDHKKHNNQPNIPLFDIFVPLLRSLDFR